MHIRLSPSQNDAAGLPPVPSAAPHAERMTYGSYLRVPELLNLQTPMSSPAHHDEMLFIISHQVYELWFKQILHEFEQIAAWLDADDLDHHIALLRGADLLDRCHKVQSLLIEQIPLLETMFASNFAEFRESLGTSSGFQSVQFRKLEFLCGAKNPKMIGLVGEGDPARPSLQAALAAPTIYDHFLRRLSRAGLAIPKSVLERDTGTPHQLDSALLDAIEPIYRDPEKHYAMFIFAEHLLHFEEKLAIWRFHHVKMVMRMIGGKMGTGGSAGAAYLAKTLEIQLFPELWAIRDRLSGLSTYGTSRGAIDKDPNVHRAIDPASARQDRR